MLCGGIAASTVWDRLVSRSACARTGLEPLLVAASAGCSFCWLLLLRFTKVEIDASSIDVGYFQRRMGTASSNLKLAPDRNTASSLVFPDGGTTKLVVAYI